MRDFVDNQDGNTLAKAINESIKQLRKEGKTPRELLISSAFFNPEGFQSLSKEIKHIPKVRLLLGAEPEPESVRKRRLPGDSPDPFWTEQRVEKSIINLEQALKEERNLLSFDLEKDKAIRTLLKFLKSEQIEVRRYTSRFLHAKAFLFLGDEKQLLTGSSNLTRAGMNTNLELNLGISETPLLEKIEEWYEQLWSDAESYDLAQIYEDLFLDYTPYEIYLMVLWQLYGEELFKESEESGTYQLSNFQQHGAERAKRILEKYHGVLIADGVGLGKTYTAGAIINQYHEEKKSVLIICPAALRDSTWSDFRTEKHIWCEILSYEQLRQDIKFGQGKSTHLQEKSLEKYALVVIDEAHHYRNEGTLNSQILRALLRQRKKVILLTATPVNNSIQDLYILYSYFLKQDAALSDEGIISLRDLFKKASNTDPLNLNPDILFPAIDALTVKRPRSFIKKYYGNDHIPTGDGGKMPIIFPRPIPKRVTYNLEELSEDFFEKLEEAIMPEDEEPKLTLARYQADNYLLERKRTLRIQYFRDGNLQNTKMDISLGETSTFLFEKPDDNPLSLEMEAVDMAVDRRGAKVKATKGTNKEEDALKQGDIIISINGLKTLRLDEFRKTISVLLSPNREKAHIGLLRSGLLKRFESSIYAFRKTLERLLQSHEVFIAALEEGKVLQREFFQEFNYTDDEEVVKLLFEDDNKFEESSKYDIDLLKADVENDIEILEDFLQVVQKVDADTSSKLTELTNQLKKIIKKAEKDGVDEVDSQQKRKVMVFSYFEETVDWIEDYLKKVLDTDPDLKPYKDRLAVVSGGKEYRGGVDQDAAVYGFSPVTTKAPEGQDEDKFDLIVCTDVLAEGLNLQQCRNIINYDLPWNPMRLVQRHGRIDRLLSNYDKVYLHSFFPEKRLDQLLGLEERIRRKLAQAAVSIGVEDAPIEGGSESDISFSDTIDEIKEVYEENTSIYEDGGNFSAAMSGEIYRAELRNAISKKEIDVQSLPRRVGAGLRKGKETGFFFCAEVSFQDDETQETKTLTRMRFIPDRWEDEDDIKKEIATCLRIIECTEDSQNIASSKVISGAYEAWQKARESILSDWLYHTDPANLQPEITKTNREVANYLRENKPKSLEQKELNDILSSIEAPWSNRDVRSLREVWTMENLDDSEKPQKLVEKIKEIGAEPYSAPKPLVPIETEDIRLVCWMAIEAED